MRSSMSDRPLVAVPADLKTFEGYRWHSVAAQYLEAAVRIAGVLPIVVPALGGEADYIALLDRVDGLLLTGSRSNVHPALYGVEPTTAHEPFDEARDATTLPLIRATLDRGLPLFAICRGMQELNVALGGSIVTEIQELPGRMDHRAPDSTVQDERFAIRHRVDIRPGSRLASIVGTGPVMVNSLHRQALDRLGTGLEVEATADDGVIEAVSVRGSPFAMGVQWHPEYWAGSDPISRRLFEAFGEAVRAHRSGAGRTLSRAG
ncbi:putative glutamine amidotransferase [Tepidamorphus gemmatus]|uniref:gamma-glutamyl-gamma-aminobutyrate hydrolase n=1 Tax=Tepidamorphus gemmatus TaxID=747076 RepID=A0A4V2UZZ0_9HYPH|nr:gamma-glutamyl-gamma-aminobutyrate hydrolase family protein [Tepidamorphus gemmatus]TCT13239.1 putative glutamine amidotransferase [Tepidamorphus gemmatus]